jgi:hypothetical protein
VHILFHTSNVVFIPLKTTSYLISSFIPSTFHTKKKCYIPSSTFSFVWKQFHTYTCSFIPSTLCVLSSTIFSYLKYEFHTKRNVGFRLCKFVFIRPRTSAGLPLWTPTRISSFHGKFTSTLVFMLPHGMAVTGTDCTHMQGIGRTFTGLSSMIMARLESVLHAWTANSGAHTQVLACAPRLWRDVTVGGLQITIVRARPPTAGFSHCLTLQD